MSDQVCEPQRSELSRESSWSLRVWIGVPPTLRVRVSCFWRLNCVCLKRVPQLVSSTSSSSVSMLVPPSSKSNASPMIPTSLFHLLFKLQPVPMPRLPCLPSVLGFCDVNLRLLFIQLLLSLRRLFPLLLLGPCPCLLHLGSSLPTLHLGPSPLSHLAWSMDLQTIHCVPFPHLYGLMWLRLPSSSTLALSRSCCTWFQLGGSSLHFCCSLQRLRCHFGPSALHLGSGLLSAWLHLHLSFPSHCRGDLHHCSSLDPAVGHRPGFQPDSSCSHLHPGFTW